MSIRYNDKSGGTPQEVLLAGTPATDLILNGTSKNPIANKTVYNALATKIESTVENLVNFYNKSQVYNKQEVRELIGAINTLTIEVVNELPTQDISATTIYFLKQSGANTYDEYIYVDNAWVKIGDTDIDLSGYLTTANFQIAIADYYTKSAIDAMIANYYTKTQVDAMVDAKQDELTFDNVPTAGSDNPVKSGGIKTALDAKQNTLTFDSTPTASSNNPVTSDGIKDAIDDTATDIYEVMGKNGAKNLNSYPYYRPDSYTLNGLTFTVNADHSVTVSGTATANTTYEFHTRLSDVRGLTLPNGRYIVNGCPSTGSMTTYRINCNRTSGGQSVVYGSDTGSGLTVELNGDDYSADSVRIGLYIYVNSGVTLDNVVFKPMIRLAEDTDSTYQPYAETNYQLTQDKMSYADNGILGAKNLLPNNKTTATVSGITYTSQSDGSFIVTGATTTSPSYSDVMSSFTLPAGTYIFSSPNTGITSDIELVLDDITSGTAVRVSTLYDSTAVTFTLGSTRTLHCYMWINSNITLPSGGVHFYPMIRLASDTDSTYQPYAMTNKELTQPEVKVLTLDSRYASAGVVYYVKVGRVVIVSLETVVLTSSATNSTPICTLPIPIARSNNTKIRACGWTTTKSVALIEVDATSGALTFGGTIPSTSEGIFGQIVYIS